MCVLPGSGSSVCARALHGTLPPCVSLPVSLSVLLIDSNGSGILREALRRRGALPGGWGAQGVLMGLQGGHLGPSGEPEIEPAGVQHLKQPMRLV